MNKPDIARETAVPPRQADPRAIDLWLRRSLAARYNAVLEEKLPDEWMALLQDPARAGPR